MKLKLYVPTIIAFFALWASVFMVLMLNSVGIIHLSYRGFAVDDMEYVYVGYNDEIEVYVDTQYLQSISPQTSRGYSFTIDENNHLLVDTGTELFTLATDGTILEVADEYNNYWEQSFGKHLWAYISSQGTQYVMHNTLGYLTLVRMDTQCILYKMPLFEYLVRFLPIIAAIVFIIVLAITLHRQFQMKGK